MSSDNSTAKSVPVNGMQDRLASSVAVISKQQRIACKERLQRRGSLGPSLGWCRCDLAPKRNLSSANYSWAAMPYFATTVTIQRLSVPEQSSFTQTERCPVILDPISVNVAGVPVWAISSSRVRANSWSP
jgi:hypothetical protein